jgi:hypothetical protein
MWDEQRQCPTNAWFLHLAKAADDKKPHRRYWPKGTEIKGAWFDGRLWSYVASRYYYFEAYKAAAQQTPAYRELARRVAAGTRLLLVGYDGHPTADLRAAAVDPSRPFGHEQVLCALLTGVTPAFPM